MDLELKDKVVVVTGASKGIGLAAVNAFRAEGARVVAGARNVEALRGLSNVTGVALDLATKTGPETLVARALETHGRVDVLVNNVGAHRPRLHGFMAIPDEEFEWSMQINFFAALRATRAALKPMLEQGSGAIVSVASVNAFYAPDTGVADYAPPKAALVNLSKSLSQEFGPKGIRINCVSPGPVSTDLWLGEGGVADSLGKELGIDRESARLRIVAQMGGLPTGRFSTPEEIATLLTLLASPRCANVTGSNWVIDGGLIKTT
jgi:NAD(P)-dependent dehydrogenase (short-subunit alcohol dehydrogenase family)